MGPNAEGIEDNGDTDGFDRHVFVGGSRCSDISGSNSPKFKENYHIWLYSSRIGFSEVEEYS